MNDGDLSIVVDKLTPELEQQRYDQLTALRNEPCSELLEKYFSRLKEGSPQWNIDHFIEGAMCFATINGTGKDKYYHTRLSGMQYQDTFTELWNRTYEKYPITLMDVGFKRQCPLGWRSEIKDDCWLLTYAGDAPLSEALNDLLKGPTTFDCGMFCQLILWMAIRYVVGDAVFNQCFQYGKGEFTVVQGWNEENHTETPGNLLYSFYDDPFSLRTSFLKHERRISTRTFYNHATYLRKHPGGMAMLHNVTQIDDKFIIFDPHEDRVILSEEEMNQKLLDAYNASRTFADREKLRLWEAISEYVHPQFAPKSCGTLIEEAKMYQHHVLSEDEWIRSRDQRQDAGRGLQMNFNVERVLKYVYENCNAND